MADSLKNIRIGAFPGTLESFLLPSTTRSFDVYYLVDDSKSERQWTAQFLDKDKIISITMHKKLKLPDASIEEIITHSNLTNIFKEHKLSALFLTRSNRIIDNWAKQNGITIISPNYQLQDRFENKIWFDAFLQKNGIPKPLSHIVNIKKIPLHINELSVLQIPTSSGGEGTFFIKSNNDINKLKVNKKIKSNVNMLLRQYIKGKSYGITIFVNPSLIALSSIRLQCFLPNRHGESYFSGVQWVPTAIFSSKLIKTMNSVYSDLGTVLHKNNFYGFANIDFIVNKQDDIFVIECNPRLSNATFQIMKNTQLISDINVCGLFIESFLHPQPPLSNPQFIGIPDTIYNGATLSFYAFPENNKSYTITQKHNNGIYSCKKGNIKYKGSDIRKKEDTGEFIYYSEVEKDEVYTETVETGLIISNNPLYDTNGNANSEAEILMKQFQS